MKQINVRCLLYLLAVTALLLVSACSSTPYRYDPSGQASIEQRAISQQLGEINVRAAVPGDDEAKALFGIPLHRRDIQAVWLEITNKGAQRARFAPYSIDRDYFPPHEVAYIHKKGLSDSALKELEQRLHALSVPRTIGPGETVSGYVFTNASPGTKAFNVDVFYTGGEAKNEHFTFFVDVPGFVPDHAEIDFAGLYSENEYIDTDANGFREILNTWQCCTTASDLNSLGRPVNVFLVAKGRDLLQTLLRSGWSETSYKRDSNYLNIADYLFNRPPDSIFKKGRDRATERNEMGLWLTPVHVDGVPVWAAQLKHAIGRQFEIGEYFFGIRLDPDVNEGRNYLLQDLWYSRSLKAYAWSNTGEFVPDENPRTDFNGNVWFSDGYRLVMWLSGEPVSFKAAYDIGWDQVIRSKEPDE